LEKVIKGSYRDHQKEAKKEQGEIVDWLVPITGTNRGYLANNGKTVLSAGDKAR
jgi:hypothetical protein